MCATGRGRPRSLREVARNVFTNWNQPLPLRVKLRLTVRNAWTRLATASPCCGHPGEPGC